VDDINYGALPDYRVDGLFRVFRFPELMHIIPFYNLVVLFGCDSIHELSGIVVVSWGCHLDCLVVDLSGINAINWGCHLDCLVVDSATEQPQADSSTP
jgi:hypothetical protein